MTTPHKCWQCGGVVEKSLFCPACNSLQAPPADYYDLLGLERRLRLSIDDLQKRFYGLSRQLHPDRFMRKSETERQYSLDASSILNDAYRALKDPVKRAQYLLSQEGFEIGEQRSKDVPPELLEEVFELNMQLQEMRAANQMGEDEPELRRDLMTAKDAFDAKMMETQAELEGLWSAWDAGVDAEDEAEKGRAKEAMVELLNERSYLRNLVRDVNEALGL